MQKYACSYYKALNIVASDLGLIPPIDVAPQEIMVSDTVLEVTSDAVIQVEVKDFSDYELE